jgi:streptothricin acetyltransferase
VHPSCQTLGVMIHIARNPDGQTLEWSALDRTLVVESELKLNLVDGRLIYEVAAVARYEKTYTHGREVDVGTESFVAYVQNRPAGEIRMSQNWNGYAYVEDLVVGQAFRRMGVATALVNQAINWSRSKHLPGVMLETQNNNVAACKLYERCGFQLRGFDSALYQGLTKSSREVALFWYWQAELQVPK